MPPLATRCASIFRLLTSRRNRSGTGARKGDSCCGTATRAASTTSIRARSARSAGATTSTWEEASGRGQVYTYSVVRAERPAAVPRTGAVRRRGRRARRGPARDDEHRQAASSTRSRSACAVEVDFKRDLRRHHDPRVPAGATLSDSVGRRERAGLELSRSRSRCTRCSRSSTTRRTRGWRRSTRCRHPTARPTSSSAWS